MKGPGESTSTQHTQQENQQVEEQYAGASISDVPSPILMDILSRLSVKSIFRLRCVCKLWLQILLDPALPKLHFSKAPACPLLRDLRVGLSRTLYLVEPKRDSGSVICDVSDKYFNFDLKLSTNFMLPALDDGSRTSDDHKFIIVNSCNGLLCLHQYIHRPPIVICNPVTGEFSVLPSPKFESVGGLGFCPKTNQYKVLVIMSESITDPGTGEYSTTLKALIYTLGSGGWRIIGNAPNLNYKYPRPIFMNSALHWIFEDDESNKLIMSFDFTGEQFLVLPSPPAFCHQNRLDEVLRFPQMLLKMPVLFPVAKTSLGVLRGCLSICDNSSFDYMDIWVMKDYGVQESWFKEYSIDSLNEERWPLGLYQPIDFLNIGDLLMYQERNAIICIHNEHRFRWFKIDETKSNFQTIAHIPSFMSLKDIMQNTVEVQNVRSRSRSHVLSLSPSPTAAADQHISSTNLASPSISRRHHHALSSLSLSSFQISSLPLPSLHLRMWCGGGDPRIPRRRSVGIGWERSEGQQEDTDRASTHSTSGEER